MVADRQTNAVASGQDSVYAAPALTSYGMPPRGSCSQVVKASYDSVAPAPCAVRANRKPVGVSVVEPATSHFRCALCAVTSNVPVTVMPGAPPPRMYVIRRAGRPSGRVICAGVPPKVRCWPSTLSLIMKWVSSRRSVPAASLSSTLPSLRPTSVMPSAVRVTGSAAYAAPAGMRAAPAATAVPWRNLRRATDMAVPFSCPEEEAAVRGP